MSDFRVTPESLTLASSLINTSGAGGPGYSLGTGGAAAQTPAARAWSDFVDRADQMLRDTVQAVDDMSSALSTAARAYEVADGTAARSLRVSR